MSRNARPKTESQIAQDDPPSGDGSLWSTADDMAIKQGLAEYGTQYSVIKLKVFPTKKRPNGKPITAKDIQNHVAATPDLKAHSKRGTIPSVDTKMTSIAQALLKQIPKKQFDDSLVAESRELALSSEMRMKIEDSDHEPETKSLLNITKPTKIEYAHSTLL